MKPNKSCSSGTILFVTAPTRTGHRRRLLVTVSAGTHATSADWSVKSTPRVGIAEHQYAQLVRALGLDPDAGEKVRGVADVRVEDPAPTSPTPHDARATDLTVTTPVDFSVFDLPVKIRKKVKK